MSTEDMISILIDEGCKAYKKNSRKSQEGRRLERHETIVIDGIEFNYWREYAVYRMAEYIREIAPDVSIDVELNGNESTITITDISDSVQQRVNMLLFNFIEKHTRR